MPQYVFREIYVKAMREFELYILCNRLYFLKTSKSITTYELTATNYDNFKRHLERVNKEIDEYIIKDESRIIRNIR